MAKKFHGNIELKTQSDIRWADADSSNYVALQAPTTVSTNITLTLPATQSAGDELLIADASGNMSFSKISDANVDTAAAIARSKIASGTADHVVINDGSGDLSSEAQLAASRGGTGQDFSAASGVIKATAGTFSADAGIQDLDDVTFTTPAQDDVLALDASNNVINKKIENANVAASAAIAFSKMEALTADRALITDGSGFVSASAVTATELGYLDGVTSAIQTQLDNLESTINNFEFKNSALDYVTDNTALPATEVSGDRYVLSHDGGAPNAAWDGASAGDIVEFNGTTWDATTPTTGTFIAVDDDSSGLYMWGGASWAFKAFEATTASTGLTKIGFDVQLDSSAAGDGLGFSTGVLSVNVDDSTIETDTDALRVKDAGITDAKLATGISATKLADGSVDNTEFQYLNGVTSAIQTQLNGKASTALSNLTVASLAAESLLVGSSSSAVSALAVGTDGQVLKVVGGSVAWAADSGTSSSATDWVTGDGTSKTVTHSLGTKDVFVQIYDKATDETIEVDSVVRTDTNTVDLTSSEAPNASGWRVIIIAT